MSGLESAEPPDPVPLLSPDPATIIKDGHDVIVLLHNNSERTRVPSDGIILGWL